MTKLSTFLWFEKDADQAANLYVSIFGGRIYDERHWAPGGPAPEGSLMSVSFEIDGHEYQAFNGGPGHPLTDANSIYVDVADQVELDEIWDKLTADGGSGVACGWLTDKYGLSWQIIPRALGELLTDPDPERSSRTMQAMLQMVKLDVAALQAAADGR
ncbi:MAG: hypothetical protein JWQ39_2152 [Glaciihabitans sp.]|nr:hypothetical protein [Glaciihabitans sp.]